MRGAGPAAPAAAAGLGPGEWRCGSGEGLREGAHGRQRGGGGGGNAPGSNGHRGPRERAPAAGAGQRCRSLQPCARGSRRCLARAVRFLVWWLKNAERDWNKMRSLLPCAAWVSCRGSALLGIPSGSCALGVLCEQLLGGCRGRPWKQSGSSNG